MAEDWRVSNARHTRGARLQRRRWEQWSPEWNHDHCAGCWAEFSNSTAPDVLHEGYTTCSDFPKGAGYEWICPACFAELKDAMDWFEAPAEPWPITRQGPAPIVIGQMQPKA